MGSIANSGDGGMKYVVLLAGRPSRRMYIEMNLVVSESIRAEGRTKT